MSVRARIKYSSFSMSRTLMTRPMRIRPKKKKTNLRQSSQSRLLRRSESQHQISGDLCHALGGGVGE